MNFIWNLLTLVCVIYGYHGINISVTNNMEANLDENDAIVLNCSYTLEPSESITFLFWQMKVDGIFVSIVSFVGGPAYRPDGEHLVNRSEISMTSQTALLVIRTVLCEDEGVYRCRAVNDDGDPFFSTEVSVTLKKSAKQPWNIPLISETELQENENLELSCFADVGKPPGFVRWWRFRASNNTTSVAQSLPISDESGNCDFVANVNATYTVTKEDNGAFFRCSSQNNIGDDQGPENSLHYRDTMKVDVLYSAIVFQIIRVPESNVYPVSTPSLNMTCVADGNPLPTDEEYKWTFQAVDSNTTEEKLSNGKFLILENLQEENSGTYTCTVTNSLNSTHSLNVALIVNGTIPQPQHVLHCLSNPCGALKTCVDRGQSYTCETDNMGVVGVVFIVITAASVAVSVGLAYHLKRLRKLSKIDVQTKPECNGNVPAKQLTDTESSTITCEVNAGPNGTNAVIYAQIQKT